MKNQNYLERLELGYQGKFDLMFKTVKNEIYELETKFTSLDSELHVSKMVIDNLTKQFKSLERKCYKNEQYSRRECQCHFW